MTLELIYVAIAILIFISSILVLHTQYSNKTYKNLPLPPSPRALPIVGHLHILRSLIHRSFHDLSGRHGPLIHLWLGSVPCVVASSPELAKELLTTNDLTFASRKHSAATKRLTYDVAFAFAPYGPYWKFIRKLSTFELLGVRNLSHFLPIRTREIHGLIQLLMKKSAVRESVNLTEELVKLTNNVISQMMMSIRCTGTHGEEDEAKNLVREVTHIFGQFNYSDFIWFCRNIDLQGIKKNYEETHRRYDALLERIISEREERRRERKTTSQGQVGMRDFLDMLLDILEDEKAEVTITRAHVKALILDFLTAATDTTAIAIEWGLAELMNHPKVLAKAQEEIDRVIGKDRLVQETDYASLPYFQAIIKENFRLHPPIPMLSRKSKDDCTVQGYIIPANTLLFINTWSIGRNPKYWENPLEFRPERFLERDGPLGSIDVKGHDYQLLPFGTGRKGCPGADLAMRELPTALAALIQCFDWKLEDGKVLDMSERPGLTVPRANDLVFVPVSRINSLDIFKSVNPTPT